MAKFRKFIHDEAVLVISFAAALVTSFFVQPSPEYLTYIDFNVLSVLFCLMLVVSGLRNAGLFNVLGQRMTEGNKKSRLLRLNLILICFFSSMFITNDVALITFVPFSIMVLNITDQKKHIIYVVAMQTVAANLGSMLTPVGNPQNLYIYSYYNVNILEFFKITAPVTAAGLVLIIIFSLLGNNENISITFAQKENISDVKKLKLYIILFVICILTVFHLVDYRVTFLAVLIIVLMTDRSMLKSVDYGLLGTFVNFFIFVGNMGKIDSVSRMISDLIKNKELILSILCSQVLSNVPTAVLLSSFTQNYKALILGTDIGGLGTLIASLASLISYKLYVKTEDARPIKYLAVLTIVNLLLIIALYFFVETVGAYQSVPLENYSFLSDYVI